MFENKCICIDLETLSTAENAIVMSAGVVPFWLERQANNRGRFFTVAQFGDPQYFVFSVEEQERMGRIADNDTLAWWSKQSELAKVVMDESSVKKTAKVEMDEFFVAINDVMAEEGSLIFAKSPSFDCTISASLFQSYGMDVPWMFWQERDVRTAQMVVPEMPFVGNQHNALDDAMHEARVCAEFLKKVL